MIKSPEQEYARQVFAAIMAQCFQVVCGGLDGAIERGFTVLEFDRINRIYTLAQQGHERMTK